MYYCLALKKCLHCVVHRVALCAKPHSCGTSADVETIISANNLLKSIY